MRPVYFAYLSVLFLFIIAIGYYFPFTVDDAYIAYRYAEKFFTTGSLVFNDGEAINALTSPLHVFLLSVFRLFTIHIVWVNKVVSLLCLLGAVFMIWKQFESKSRLQILVLVFNLLSAPILLWTFGGIETIYLLLVITAIVIGVWRLTDGERQLKRLTGIFFLMGIAFLFRYDSAIFLFPVALYLWIRSNKRDFLIAATVGALLPVFWLSVSYIYYGDLLPTSFYTKTPGITFEELYYNFIYIFYFSIYILTIPAVIVFLVYPASLSAKLKVWIAHFRNRWWLYAGLLLTAGYGLTMATKHMMFSFRFFAPYIPVTSLLLLDLLDKISEIGSADQKARVWRSRLLFTCIVAGWLFQAFHLFYTYNYSVNGLARVGEYRQLNMIRYQAFIDILAQQAAEIREHWQTKATAEHRPPRIHTYAGGVAAYRYMDAYIYDMLIAYRHKDKLADFEKCKLSADYILLVTPVHGSLKKQLPAREKAFQQISSHRLDFNGVEAVFWVFYNPDPSAHTLGRTIND